MERTRRRYWTWAVTAMAVLVIAAATASGLFQLVVQSVPDYRADVERYVREVTGRPVRIGTLELTWRYTYPSLDLGSVALLDPDGQQVLLEAERLRLGFSLGRLLKGDFTPNRLELHGLALDLTVDRDGRVSAPAWPPAPGEQGEGAAAALEPLARFDQLRVERCRLNLRDLRGRRPRTWSFGVAEAELSRGLLRSSLEAELLLPAELGESARLSAQLQGEWLDLATWSGDWSVELGSVNAATWVQPYLVQGAQISAERLNVHAAGELGAGDLKKLSVSLESGPVKAVRPPHAAGFSALHAELSAEVTEQGWTAKLSRFELETAEGPSPGTQLTLKAGGPDDSGTYEAEAGHIRLSDFAPWLRLVEVPEELLTVDRLSGNVDKLVLRVQRDGSDLRYAARMQFTNLGLPAGDRAVGAAGLSGELAIDDSGGRVVLQPAPARLQLPALLETGEVPLDSLEGEAQWRRSGADWLVEAPRLRWRMLGTGGEGQLKLVLPGQAGRSPELSLQADFTSSDVTLAKPLMPRHWSRGLKNWLDRSILGGRVPQAHLKIDGALADFPFIGKPGTWELDIQVRDALLAFHPAWPQVDAIDALVKFRGNGLAIECSGARIAGQPVLGATAGIADFHIGDLVIDGSTRGESARYFEYLSASPLRETLSGLLANRVKGAGSAEIHLEVPLADTQKTHVRGVAMAEGIELAYPGLREPFKDVQGAVAFDGAAIKSDQLQAKWYSLPLQASIAPRAEGGSLLATTLRFTLDEAGRGPSELIPAWLRKFIAGDIAWQAALRLGGGAGSAPLRLATDLTGVEVRLPAPIGKAASEAWPLDLTVGASADAPLHITLDYRERFGADLKFRHRGENNLQLESGALRLGGGPMIEAKGPGMRLGGAAGEVDARAWYDVIEELSQGGSDSGLSHADLHIARAYWNEYSLSDVRYQWQREAKGGWSVALVGAGGAGEVRWNPLRPGILTGRLQSLAVQSVPSHDEDRPPSDPARWPVVDFDVAKLQLNQADLGHAQLVSERVEDGQRLRTLVLGGGSVTATATGEWRRAGHDSAARSTGLLDFDLTTTDIAGLLKALHYAPNLDAKQGHVKAQLRWPPAAPGLDWRLAEGKVSVKFENGQLRAVEPGAGRVLGLVNFYALPRRLTLNFRDVVSSGLGFDKISGNFVLAGGDARTDDLQVAGPSLRMETRGRIGLAARDYDQQVTVYPDVSAGVTLGALALGGPVAGVLTFIAQQVMGKPLNQVTQLSYRLTGSWDNPQVERVQQQAAEPSSRPPTSPSQRP